jgi:hypothetical protein
VWLWVWVCESVVVRVVGLRQLYAIIILPLLFGRLFDFRGQFNMVVESGFV